MQKVEQIRCEIGSYELTVSLLSSSIILHAFSELTGKVFEGRLTNESLPSDLRINYGECTTIYRLIAEASKARKVTFS